MLKNSEWGAITYLAHSKYGAGINTSYTQKSNVSKNGAYPSSSADADGTSSQYGITGCGPVSAGSTSNYTDGTPLSADVIESPTACSQDLTRAYNGSLGVLSSTTNTIYGVYGLSGGASEYVMGNRTTSTTETSTHQQKSRTWTYTLLHLMVHLVLNPAGPVVHQNTITTMTFVLLKLVVVQLPTKLPLSSLSPVTISPGAGRSRTSCIPAVRGSAVGAVLTIVTRVRSIRIGSLAATTPATVRARR